MAAKSKPDLRTQITSDFPDNTTGLITPAILRAYLTDNVDSSLAFQVERLTSSPVTLNVLTDLVVFEAGTSIVNLVDVTAYIDRTLIFVNNSGVDVTVNADTGFPDTIDGLASTVLVDEGYAILTSDAANNNWIISFDSKGIFIDSLVDVDTTTVAPIATDFLSFDGVDWVPVAAPAAGVAVLDDLTDVDTTTLTPAAGHFLKFDGAGWVNFVPIAAAISDFESAVTANTSVAANTAKITNATHTGEVTGSTSLTVDKTSISNKTLVTAVGADHILIGDASDTDNLKKALVSDLLTDNDAIHDNVNSEISAITEKVTPIAADLIIIEDSEATNAKKRVQIGNLPAPSLGSIDDHTDVDTTTSAPVTGQVLEWDSSNWVPAAHKVRYAIPFAKNGNLTEGGHLKFGDVTTTNPHGAVVPQDGIIEVVSVSRTDSDAADIEILVEGVLQVTVATAALSVVDTSMSFAVTAGDMISVRNKSGGNTISNTIVMVIIESEC